MINYVFYYFTQAFKSPTISVILPKDNNLFNKVLMRYNDVEKWLFPGIVS